MMEWKVLRFWSKDVIKNTEYCVEKFYCWLEVKNL
ncbi:hypothetical protein [Xylocopilactobacillus apis]